MARFRHDTERGDHILRLLYSTCVFVHVCTVQNPGTSITGAHICAVTHTHTHTHTQTHTRIME